VRDLFKSGFCPFLDKGDDFFFSVRWTIFASWFLPRTFLDDAKAPGVNVFLWAAFFFSRQVFPPAVSSHGTCLLCP